MRFNSLFFALIMSIASVCFSAPKPAVVQAPDDWTLDVKYENPSQIMVKLPGQKTPTRFWYIILSLTNKSAMDVDFYPKCELMTDTFQIIPSGKQVPDVVFSQIKLRYQSAYPFLEWVEKSENKILQGDDNARDIAIIWPDFDLKAKNVSFFISGLSNETALLHLPSTKNADGSDATVFLRKTLSLEYSIAGDPAFRTDAKLALKTKNWIMR